jgi:hypothetical protein
MHVAVPQHNVIRRIVRKSAIESRNHAGSISFGRKIKLEKSESCERSEIVV